MRKILVLLMLVCAFGLFAQIPAGTKSIAVLAGSVGDLLADDFVYAVEVNAGYFIMDALEIDGILGIGGSTYEGSETEFLAGLGLLYHFPISPMFGLYGGAAFTYESTGDGIMAIPIEAGLELFITQNNAIRLADRFTFNLEEGMDNTDEIVLGTVHYFQ